MLECLKDILKQPMSTAEINLNVGTTQPMSPQYPIPPIIPPSKPKEIAFFDGRRACVPERLIDEAFTPVSVFTDATITRKAAQLIAWYRETPVTVMTSFDNGSLDVYVVEPGDMKGDAFVYFQAVNTVGKPVISHMVTSDLERVRKHIIAFMLRHSEFTVGLRLPDLKYPFYRSYHTGLAKWPLNGPRRTKTKLQKNILDNFKDVMRTICSEINAITSNQFNPTLGNYSLYIPDLIVHEENLANIKRAIEDTGWNVEQLNLNDKSLYLVIS